MPSKQSHHNEWTGKANSVRSSSTRTILVGALEYSGVSESLVGRAPLELFTELLFFHKTNRKEILEIPMLT